MLSLDRFTTALFWLIALSLARSAHAWAPHDVKETFVAFSMQAAETRVATALRQGEDFRRKNPELYHLGFITRPIAVVLDKATGDWIVVGIRDPKCPMLTLDDWAVALRARYLFPNHDPGVSIDPHITGNPGDPNAWKHFTRQDVRFFAGIENTHFGLVCFRADWLMKRISLGLESVPATGIRSWCDLVIEDQKARGHGRMNVMSRFWFVPIANDVDVQDGLVILKEMQIGVFTNVDHAEIDGQPVVRDTPFEYAPSSTFARSFSDNYDIAAAERDDLASLRELTALAALAQGLTQASEKPQVDYWLRYFPIERVDTELEADVLYAPTRGSGFEARGGVKMSALVMRLRAGEAAALAQLVLMVRPKADALTWGFDLAMKDGQPIGVSLRTEFAEPSSAAGLFSQGLFLQEQEHFGAAIESYNAAIAINRTFVEALNNRGCAFVSRGNYDSAITDFTRAIKQNARYSMAYLNRGIAYLKKRNYALAIADFTQAIAINPRYAQAYNSRGRAYAEQGKREAALADYNRAIEVDKNYALAYNNRRNAAATQRRRGGRLHPGIDD